jgi:hypothetical protein
MPNDGSSGGSITARGCGAVDPGALGPAAMTGPNTGSVASVMAYAPITPGGVARCTMTRRAAARSGSRVAASSISRQARASARPLVMTAPSADATS